MRKFIEGHWIKCNEPSDHLYFIMMDKRTEKFIQNPVKHLIWSTLQKYLEAFSR